MIGVLVFVALAWVAITLDTAVCDVLQLGRRIVRHRRARVGIRVTGAPFAHPEPVPAPNQGPSMPRARILLIALALVAGLFATAAQCQTATGSGSSDINCSINSVQLPATFDPGNHEYWIVANTNISCDPVPDSIRVLLSLEKWKGPGNWVTVWREKVDTTLPGQSGHTYHLIWNFCKTGTYRLRARITPGLGDTKVGGIDEPSASARISC